jgi:hypothetical protein
MSTYIPQLRVETWGRSRLRCSFARVWSALAPDTGGTVHEEVMYACVSQLTVETCVGDDPARDRESRSGSETRSIVLLGLDWVGPVWSNNALGNPRM